MYPFPLFKPLKVGDRGSYRYFLEHKDQQDSKGEGWRDQEGGGLLSCPSPFFPFYGGRVKEQEKGGEGEFTFFK